MRPLRWLRPATELLGSLWKNTFEHELTRHAAALAFFTLVSLAPASFLVLGIAGIFVEQATARSEIVEQVTTQLGPEAAEVVEGVLRSIAEGERDPLSDAVGLLALLFGTTAVFAQLQDALNTIFGVDRPRGRLLPALVRKRLLSFLMVLAVGFLFVASQTATAVLSFLHGTLGPLPELPSSFGLAVSTTDVVSFVVLTVFFGLVYWILPDAELDLRDAVAGALVTSALFSVGRWIIELYLSRSDRASTYGAAGSLVIFLLWIYFSSLIFLFGAEMTREYAVRTGGLAKKQDPSDSRA